MRNDLSATTDVKNQSILVCANEDIHYVSISGMWQVSSPLMCLSAATENSYDAVILFITGSSLTKAASMIELCTVLKNNQYTSAFPLLAVCSAVNRRIIEHLKEADVDFVVFQDDWKKIDPDANPAAFMQFMQAENRPAQVLKGLCPYMHYAPINADKELITCKAYVNWLVLGPRRLRELCQTTRHPDCPYYQSPRLPQ